MKKLLITAILVAAALTGCADRTGIRPYNEGITVTPAPLEMNVGEGEFRLGSKTVFVCADREAADVARFFAGKIGAAAGFTAEVVGNNPQRDYITLELTPEAAVNDEGYTLAVDADRVEVRARTPRGLFYGMQTVLQLLPAEIESRTKVDGMEWVVPAVVIRDQPRFGYRGYMQDVCRHFVDVENLKKQIDVLAMYKINRFHWHLTEDQAWRIEIKKYPKLTEISSRRMEGEGFEYGPYFYTQEQIREVVAYAKERFIEVIPEIEFPGHAVAALTAYPEFSCTGGPFEVRNVWGVSSDIYCAGNEDTFRFLFDILEEVIPLFESEYFHVGGDEAPKERWQNCPKCQARIKALGLKADSEHTPEAKLQSYFMKRVEKFLADHGKRLIGWDEILDGGLPATATVMSWRGEQRGIIAANRGHDVIMSPNTWLYLDNYQGDRKILPPCNKRDIPLSRVYAYDPLPSGLDADKIHHILGPQCNVWAEYMYTPEIVQWCANPRVIALAEVGWSAPEHRDYDDFLRRIDNQRERLALIGVNYYIPVPQDKGAPSCNNHVFTDRITLGFETTEPVMKIVYTTDGSEPGLKSKEYVNPLTFDRDATLKLRSVLPSGRMGEVRTVNIEKQDYRPAVEVPADKTRGLKAEYYPGIIRNVSQLEGRSPVETEIVPSPQLSKHNVTPGRDILPENNWNTVLNGHIWVENDGVYYFSTGAEQFFLDGELFITNEDVVKRFSLYDRAVALSRGYHEVKLIRLASIVGGWHPQWAPMSLSVRPAGEPDFTMIEGDDINGLGVRF